MDTKKKKAIMGCTSFDELLNAEYGERGSETRERYEAEAEAFCLAECLKEQRRLAGLTQEHLPHLCRAGTTSILNCHVIKTAETDTCCI